MVDDQEKPLVMLQHGDKEVSLKDLARQAGAKAIQPASVEDAQRYTGYMVGGISPFGTKRQMPVYAEETILALPRLYINGGMRGFILEMEPSELSKALAPKPVRTAR